MRDGFARRRWKGFGGVSALLLIGVLVASPTVQSADLLIAEPAPDFALKSLSGRNLRLSEFRSQVVLVNFWADWCGTCKEQLSDIEKLYSEHNGNAFEVLSINIDRDVDKARRTVTNLGLNFPVLSDAQKRISRLYDLDATPSVLLIDAHGVVRHIHRGYSSGDMQLYRSELMALLPEQELR